MNKRSISDIFNFLISLRIHSNSNRNNILEFTKFYPNPNELANVPQEEYPLVLFKYKYKFNNTFNNKPIQYDEIRLLKRYDQISNSFNSIGFHMMINLSEYSEYYNRFITQINNRSLISFRYAYDSNDRQVPGFILHGKFIDIEDNFNIVFIHKEVIPNLFKFLDIDISNWIILNLS